MTDRPDFTESALVVAPGTLQLEMGFARIRHSGEDGRWVIRTAPLPLLRLGVSRRFELRLGGLGYVSEFEQVSGARRSGVTDLQVGMKIQMLNESGRKPDAALIPSLTVPTGNGDISPGGYNPGLVLALAKALPHQFSIGGNLGLSAATDGTGEFLRRSASVSLGRDLPVGGLAGFVETYTAGPEVRGGQSFWVVTGGVTRLFGRNTQVDFYVERSWRGPFPFWGFGIGFAFRTPVASFQRD